MLSWKFRKVFHVLFMWIILPSMYLVPDLQVWSVSFRRQLIELSNGLIPMASSFQLLKQKVLFHNKRKIVGVPSLNLYGELIPSTDNVRFLGLVFDRRLTWANHIRRLKESCKKPLEILKKLSRVTFGADRAILHRVSTSMVQSKLDYGCHIYGSASDSLLHELSGIMRLD